MPTRPQSTSSYSDYEDSDGEAGPSRNPREPPRWYQRPVIWVLAFVPVFTGFLGVWQIKRLRWKLDLIDELESKLKREPLSLPRNIECVFCSSDLEDMNEAGLTHPLLLLLTFLSLSSLDVLLNNFTNRLFALKGRFPPPTPENTVFLGPRVRDGVRGYHVIQPLDRSAGGGQVVVDRGFVPKDKIINNNGDPSTWRLMDVSGYTGRSRWPSDSLRFLSDFIGCSITSLLGHGVAQSAFDTSVGDHLLLLPRPKERNAFTPANDVDRHIWYFADVAELQHYLSGEWAAAKQRSASGTAAVDGDSEDETDSYTPSHGVADSVKSMLGLGREAQREILPVYLEEIFGAS